MLTSLINKHSQKEPELIKEYCFMEGRMENLQNIPHDELEAWMILWMLLLSNQREWEKLRIGALDSERPSQELTDYFNRVLKDPLPTVLIEANTFLYRARSINSGNEGELKVNLSEITNEYIQTVLSHEDYELIKHMENNGGLYLTLEDLFQLKVMPMEEYTSDQLKHIECFRKKYSIPSVYGFDAARSGVPPEKYRKEGRLNSISDAYLYLALEKETAIHEMRPSLGQQYSLASFQSTTDIKIVNLTGEYSSLNETPSVTLLPADKLSEPNIENDNRFYRITQHMAHFLQKRGLDGIKYKSALRKGEYNVLLFDDTKVRFVSSEIVAINDVRIDYSCLLPFPD